MPKIPDDDTHDTQPMHPIVPPRPSPFHEDDSGPGTDDLVRDEGDLPALVIPRGGAQQALSEALDALTRAYVRLEGVAMACARALDGAQ
jgi:hypothetical protein